MYIVTGGAGFIGSAMVAKLNAEGIDEILIVDELESTEKWKNLVNRRFVDYLHKDEFLRLLSQDKLPAPIKGIIHMGACSSTTEQNAEYLIQNNYRYTRILADWALRKRVRFIYASSAATYGDGSLGYSDDDESSLKLKPLNMYGYSKQLFDLWAIRSGAARQMVGLKFFNVYGPNEYHKGDMMSVICKAYSQIQATGKVQLFKSYRPDFKDGEQKRDFVFVKDCTAVIWRLINEPSVNGIFNLGSGEARSWNDLIKAVFAAMGKKPKIEYIEMPEVLRGKYQYFTEAKMAKLEKTGLWTTSTSLEDGVSDYVRKYLSSPDRYL